MVDVDYLVIGAGAMGMAFADVILTETDATIALVDRRPRPGGHWNDAYPHVRLHQPSSFYGVNSRVLGTESIDRYGWNQGLSELASGSEVVGYFDQVLRQDFMATGRVQYFPLSDYEGDGTFRSLVTGERTALMAGKVVDATYMNVVVPSVRPPLYDVADGVTCIPPNRLGEPGMLPGDGAVVVGGGKTGMDAVLFMLENGVPADDITWIRPRDQWCINRNRLQPMFEFFHDAMGSQAATLKAIAESQSMEDMFERFDEAGVLLRIDPDVTPTMYRCATVSELEIEALRTVTNVVRLGHVHSITTDQITLDDGSIATSPGTIHIDCTADGLAQRPAVPIFDGAKITLQSVRTCQQVFSAAFIAHIEATHDDDETKNGLATVIPHPDDHLDWARVTLAHMKNSARWQQDPELAEWLSRSRLYGLSGSSYPEIVEPDKLEVMATIAEFAMPAAMRLQEYVDAMD